MKAISILIQTLAAASAVSATTVLAPNDVQIVAYASDSDEIAGYGDAFAFVTWIDLSPQTEIRFTDKGWMCENGFQSGESELIFTAQNTISAGSVFEFHKGITTEGPGQLWNLASGTWSLSNNDQIYVYQGSLANPSFVFAFDSTGGWETCGSVNDANKGARPEALVDGVSAVSFDHSDNFWYRPWYARSATLPTLKEWMVNRKRFKTTSLVETRKNEYEAPLSGFTIRSGQRGANGYTEYIPGTAPCIILSGHDGDLEPESIANRTTGCWDGSSCNWTKNCPNPDGDKCRAVFLNDENTQDMARRVNDYFEAHTGYSCHLIVSRLARKKLDPNREVQQAAQFDSAAIAAYEEFHNFTTTARLEIETNHPCGAGLLIDMHGHTHPEARIELGYKLSASQLRSSDEVVDTLAYTSSIKNMLSHTGSAFSALIRGNSSMGALFERPTDLNGTGYLSVPSPKVNAPSESEDYFQGGYNIETHGSQNAGSIDAIQIEFPRYLRAQEYGQQEDVLTVFGEVVLPQMLALHYPVACDVMVYSSPTFSPTPFPQPGTCSSSSPTPNVICTSDADCNCVRRDRALRGGSYRGEGALIFNQENRKLPPSTCANEGQKAVSCGSTSRNAKDNCCVNLICDEANSGSCTSGTATTDPPTAAPTPVCMCESPPSPTSAPTNPPTNPPTSSCGQKNAVCSAGNECCTLNCKNNGRCG
mmetsp:Transcript_11594/g.16340  ORF Transcript_11594/g.16340 Transcript_11594/m.16340 type:complete len:704 (-) Transcript_11594:555-2666(-)